MSKHKHRRQRKKTKKAQKIHAKSTALVQTIENDIQAQVGKADKQEHKERPKMGVASKVWKWVIESANGVIAIFTIIIAGIAILQSFIYSAQLSGAKIGQRAYGYAKTANIIAGQPSQPLPQGAQRQVEVTFGNSGQTWARNVSTSVNFHLSSQGIPQDFAYPMEDHSPPVLLPPQGETELLKALSEDQFSDVTHGKLMLFVYGEITYQDVFGDHHRTEYMFQLGGMVKDSNTGQIKTYMFWQGPTHNCADDDCPPQKAN